MSRPQHEITMHPGLHPGEYRDVVAHLGRELLDLGYTHRTPDLLHPGGLSAGAQKQAGDSR